MSRSSWSSTSSRRWEKERSRRSSRSTSPAEGRLSAAIAACWASAAFSRAPKAAASAFSSIVAVEQRLGELADRLLAARPQALLIVELLGHRQQLNEHIRAG